MTTQHDPQMLAKLAALPLADFQQAACEAARLGGVELTKRMGDVTVQKKGPRDLVTEADFASQRVIAEYMLQRFPDHAFIGEESDAETESQLTAGEFCWIVDPLDGTTNYIHQLPSFSVSVALQYCGQSIVGAVWDPILEQMYSATLGGGAFCNQQSIQASDCRQLNEALFVISLARGARRTDPQMEQFLNLLEAAGSIRRLGSAALNLCYIGRGWIDGYWAKQLSAWDVAAGSLIATEAGAKIECVDGRPFSTTEPEFIAGCNASLLQQAQQVLSL
jgi:myo-inositol-1(or 4)-monophosphatase